MVGPPAISTLYEQLGQNEKALDYCKLAQASGAALPPAEYAQLLSNLGTLCRRLGDPVKALENYQSARRHSDGQIHVLHNIGNALALDYKNFAAALGPFTEALKLAEATSNGTDFSGCGLLYWGRETLIPGNDDPGADDGL